MHKKNQSSQVSLYYLNQVAEILKSHHISVANWLANEGLSEQDLYNSQCMVDTQVYCRLISDAIALSRLEHLGLIVGAQLSINHHGALGFALLNCGSIKDMLVLFERYLITRTPLFNLQVDRNKQHTRLTLYCSAQEPEVLVPLTEVLVAAFISIVKSADARVEQSNGLNQNSLKAVKRIQFNYAQPDYTDKYHQLLGCKLAFSCNTTEIWLDNHIIDKQLRAVDEHSLSQAKVFCEQELSSVLAHASWKSKVLMQIISRTDSFPDIKCVASELNVSSRTLHRHLEREGTQFKKVVDEAFCALAKRDLASKVMTIKQVAYKLGYSDTANFRRAFKRWTAMTPQDYVNSLEKKQ